MIALPKCSRLKSRVPLAINRLLKAASMVARLSSPKVNCCCRTGRGTIRVTPKSPVADHEYFRTLHSPASVDDARDGVADRVRRVLLPAAAGGGPAGGGFPDDSDHR